MHRRDLAAYGTLAIVWGLSFIVVLKASRAFGWAGSASFRALVAGSAMLVVAGVTRRRLDFSGGWRPVAVVGATTVAGQQIGLSFAAPRIRRRPRGCPITSRLRRCARNWSPSQRWR